MFPIAHGQSLVCQQNATLVMHCQDMSRRHMTRMNNSAVICNNFYVIWNMASESRSTEVIEAFFKFIIAYYHLCPFIRRFNWPRDHYVTANNCLRIIVCSCASKSLKCGTSAIFDLKFWRKKCESSFWTLYFFRKISWCIRFKAIDYWRKRNLPI